MSHTGPNGNFNRPSVSVCTSKNEREHQRKSFSDDLDSGGRRVTVDVENTYRLAPEPNEVFQPSVARTDMEDVLKMYLDGKKYSEATCRSLSKNLANIIKTNIKRQQFSKRYKYVCLVSIGQLNKQGVWVCSRCLWNTDTDNFASASYKNRELFAVASLYAFYLE